MKTFLILLAVVAMLWLLFSLLAVASDCSRREEGGGNERG